MFAENYHKVAYGELGAASPQHKSLRLDERSCQLFPAWFDAASQRRQTSQWATSGMFHKHCSLTESKVAQSWWTETSSSSKIWGDLERDESRGWLLHTQPARRHVRPARSAAGQSACRRLTILYSLTSPKCSRTHLQFIFSTFSGEGFNGKSRTPGYLRCKSCLIVKWRSCNQPLLH